MKSNRVSHRGWRDLALPGLFALLAACSSCSCGESGGGGGKNWEFGEPTPCVNEARPTEACVPGGNYLMGCVPDDTECEENEKPLVMVTLSPFFADKDEATIAEVIDWLNAIKGDEGITAYPGGVTWTEDGETMTLWSQTWDDIGVVKMVDGEYVFNAEALLECENQGGAETVAGGFSWLGAKMYCEWKGMQLPTEAQWEAAARGQTFNEFPCGSDLMECAYGVYGCCGESEACYGYYGDYCACCAPFPVFETEYCLSPFGLTGMYGNAVEWTSDWADDGHRECVDGCVDPQPSSDPPEAGMPHIGKGGDVGSDTQRFLRISARAGFGSDDAVDPRGVRCVRPDAPAPTTDAGPDAAVK